MSVRNHIYQLVGVGLPEDSGYALFAAISNVLPEIHGSGHVQIAPVRGSHDLSGKVRLDFKSHLYIRGLTNDQAQALDRKPLLVDGHPVVPVLLGEKELEPSTRLTSRIVVFRDVLDEDDFEYYLNLELARAGIRNVESLRVNIGRGRVVRMKDRRLLGYAVTIEGILPSDSLRLQTYGLGMCRSMGCGVFYPGNKPRKEAYVA